MKPFCETYALSSLTKNQNIIITKKKFYRFYFEK